MSNHAGLDVLYKEVSICVMDGDGRALTRTSTLTDPKALMTFID